MCCLPCQDLNDMETSIAILLCVYNSGRYLAPLLDSLYAQSCQDFSLYVHDDGSTDGTMSILEDYAARFGRMTVLADPHPGRRAKGSFLFLLENVQADYYMFCDHDDVWLPDKIAQTREAMLQAEKEHPGKAVLVHTDLCVVDENLHCIHPSFARYNRIDHRLLDDFRYLAVCNGYTGCTMMLNAEARRLSLPMSESATMHDRWIGLKVLDAGGTSVYLPQATILYRQHGDNEIGAQKVGWKHYFARLCHLRDTWRDNRRNLAMVRTVRPMRWSTYLYYKLRYYAERYRKSDG